jgi:hypothetical protein
MESGNHLVEGNSGSVESLEPGLLGCLIDDRQVFEGGTDIPIEWDLLARVAGETRAVTLLIPNDPLARSQCYLK